VRVVQIPGFSAELCGGTHLRATGEIGLFRITQEGASAAGIRRLVAVTGRTAEELARHDSLTLRRIRDLLQSGQGEEEDKLNKLIEERKALRKEASKASQSKAAGRVDRILEESVTVDGVRLATGRVDCAGLDALKTAGDSLRDGLGSGVGLLASVIDDKVMLVCVVTADLIKERGLRAGEIVSKVAAIVGGGGGGKPHMATAGGKDVSKIDEAINQAPEILAGFF
jgi:alanyl-tRNA synthetase